MVLRAYPRPQGRNSTHSGPRHAPYVGSSPFARVCGVGTCRNAGGQEVGTDVSEHAKMTRAEAGRKGGLKTKETRGTEHFARIGKIGGKKGGEATKRKLGLDHYREIGRKGGSR